MKATVKKATSKTWTYLKLISIRTIGAILVGGIGIFIGYQIDYANVERSDPSTYLQYTQFQVQNARVGEDVNFSVCRDYQRPYLVQSNLNIYVIQNPGTETEKPVPVFGRTNSTTLNNKCENKTVLHSDFAHKAGEYEIRACVAFDVRYDIEKTVCETSNRYRIYDTPLNLQEQIDQLKAQQDELEKQRAESENISTPNIGSSSTSTTRNVVPQASQQSPTTTPPTQAPTTPQQPVATTPETAKPSLEPVRTCAVDLLGITLLCR